MILEKGSFRLLQPSQTESTLELTRKFTAVKIFGPATGYLV